MSLPREVLVPFLIRAKRRTYAGQGDDATVAALLPGAKQLEWREGQLLYRDVYFGMQRFVGQEVVYHGDLAGPAAFRDSTHAYSNERHGDLDSFWGTEVIRAGPQVVYELRYAGGAIS
jgi:hypothetical protein